MKNSRTQTHHDLILHDEFYLQVFLFLFETPHYSVMMDEKYVKNYGAILP